MACLILVLMLALLATPVYAAPADFDSADSYDGAWASADELKIEFFLPEGWTGASYEENGAAGYRAQSADGAVTLDVTSMGELPGGRSVAEWAAGRVPGAAFESAKVGGQSGAVARTAEGLWVVAPCGGSAYGFEFRFEGDALTEAMAVNIAGSCTDAW